MKLGPTNMEIPQEKSFPDLRWVPLDGTWEEDGKDELLYIGHEDDLPISSSSLGRAEDPREPKSKYVSFGTVLFDQHFKEGRIKRQVEFVDVDNRSAASIAIQYDPATKDMLTFGISGAGASSGYFFNLMRWGSPQGLTQ